MTRIRLDLHTFSKRTKSSIHEPEVTPSILAGLPECLRGTLLGCAKRQQMRRKAILVSSNSLANRFILSRWGIRPSQRRRYRNLFTTIRKQCRVIFNHYLSRGRIEWQNGLGRHVFGIYKFDEIRGNLILGFVLTPPDSEWTLPVR